MSSLGVKNAVSVGNEHWGSMRSSVPGASLKFEELFKQVGISLEKPLAYILGKHVDGIQFLTKENIFFLKSFQPVTFTPESSSWSGFYVEADAVITKQHISLCVAVADCAVIVLTAIDKIDGNRFLVFVHAGLSGTLLNVVGKAIDAAHDQYKFKNSDLTCAIYPSISGKYYRKNNRLLNEASSEGIDLSGGWITPFSESEVSLDFRSKIITDLKKIGVKDILTSDLDPYVENREGNLFSRTYAKDNNLDLECRFTVCVSLE